MKATIERRLRALEVRKGIGYQPFRVCFYDGPRRSNMKEVEADTAEAEANGERLILVFFVPPNRNTP